jgi:UDP-N-acetylmuramoyl-tripeptide--D-alanyl-D-alanine ligase
MGTLAQVAHDTGGRLHGVNQAYEAISTDTRTLKPGDLFFALRGERFDANAFVTEAFKRGAAGAVVEARADVDLAQIEVDDSQRALGKVAHEWRMHFNLPVIGITGSNGKTTIKELTSAILRAELGEGSVLATEGNFNNEIGLPLTLFRLNDTHKAAVIEMGASKPGDIGILRAIAAPGVVVISNAARAHLEGFGSVADVAKTKGEILDNLSAQSTAVLNRDDQFYADWAERAQPAKVLSFGMDRTIGFTFTMLTPAGAIDIELPLAGQHNVMNALAASAAAIAAGASLAAVKRGLAASSNVSGRLRTLKLVTGTILYDDAYNANPDSVAAAIEFLTALPDEPWLVLGDMGELGPDAEALHRDIGQLARDLGAAGLFCTGMLSRATAEGFGEDARWFESQDALFAALQPELIAGRNVLIKASRFVGLDQLVNRIETEVGT